jgi:hypothetical protein
MHLKFEKIPMIYSLLLPFVLIVIPDLHCHLRGIGAGLSIY